MKRSLSKDYAQKYIFIIVCGNFQFRIWTNYENFQIHIINSNPTILKDRPCEGKKNDWFFWEAWAGQNLLENGWQSTNKRVSTVWLSAINELHICSVQLQKRLNYWKVVKPIVLVIDIDNHRQSPSFFYRVG